MRTDRSIASGSFTRGLDALDTLRHESDGEKEFVQRSARGSGSRPRYRIDPAVSFVDTRTSEQLSPFAATLSRLHDIATELRRREY